VPVHTRLGAVREQVGARRGRNIGVVAAARQLTELVFYGLRDEQHSPPSLAAAAGGGVSRVRYVVGAGRGSHDPRTRRGRPS
jgi:hypothetical protein